MSLYETFDQKFDLKYHKPSPERVSDFIEDTKQLLQMMTNSSRPVNHLHILNYTKVAHRVLTWKIGDQTTLMSLLWHVATEISKGFALLFPQATFPKGGAKKMPSFILLLGQLSLESYYRFMSTHPVESSFFARNGWPVIVADLKNENVLKHFSECLHRMPVMESLFVLSKSLLYLTVADPAMRTVIVFLAAKCGSAYQKVWDEAKEDVLRLHTQMITAGNAANEVLRPHCFGDIPESQAYSYISCMPLRGWRPPGEAYLAFYNSLREKYSAMVRIEKVDYSSTNYISVEKEFGYFLERTILDFKLNGTQLNKKSLETLKAMVESHFKSNTKPLVQFITTVHTLSREVEFQEYYESRSLEQFKLLLEFQAFGEVLSTAILSNAYLKKELLQLKEKNLLGNKKKWFNFGTFKSLFKSQKHTR